MPDNITAPAEGAVLATDEIGGVHYPRTKLSFGPEGSVADVSSSDPLPVSISGTLPVSGTFWQATQPISAAALPLPTGAATEATLAAFSAKLPASTGAKAASGSLSIVPATSTDFPITAAALPLPTGAATSAKQDTQTAAIDNLASAKRWFPITPADSNLATVPDVIYVGGAGTVVARGDDGNDATFTATAGSILPIRPAQVRASSTATGLIGLVN